MPVVTEAKTLLEAVETAKNKLETEKIIYKSTEKVSGKLFKSKTIEVTAISYNELLDEIKSYLKELIENMGLEIQFESSIREDTFEVTLYSNNNSILIGKNGQNLKAFETIVRAKINGDWGVNPKIVLDVENYKEKKISNIERTAKRVAREVTRTKIDAALENMNSYNRRIIHNVLTNYKNIVTVSEGEEPNRHVVIKYVESKEDNKSE